MTGRDVSLGPALRRCAVEMSAGVTSTRSVSLMKEMTLVSTDLWPLRSVAPSSVDAGASEARSAAVLSGRPRMMRLSHLE